MRVLRRVALVAAVSVFALLGVVVASLPRDGYPTYLLPPSVGALVLGVALLLSGKGSPQPVGYGTFMSCIGIVLAAVILGVAEVPEILRSNDFQELKRAVARAKANPIRGHFAKRTLSRAEARLKDKVAHDRPELAIMGVPAGFYDRAEELARLMTWPPYGFWTGDWSPAVKALQSEDFAIVCAGEALVEQVMAVEGNSEAGKSLRNALTEAVLKWRSSSDPIFHKIADDAARFLTRGVAAPAPAPVPSAR